MSELLPANSTAQERAIADATARIGQVPVPVGDMWTPGAIPSTNLAWLAWAFSVDQWDPAWNDAQKRDAIQRSFSVHKYKGTIGAVRDALEALGYGVQVQEWFNQIPAGTPYTFDLLLEADQVGIPQEALAKIIEVVETTKNLRSHLGTIKPSAKSLSELFLAAAAGTGNEITVTNYVYSPILINELALVIPEA